MEFLIHPYPGRKLKKKPKLKPAQELKYFHKDDFSDVVLGNIEQYTVGLPSTVKEFIVDGVKRETASRWMVRYDIEDTLGSREEYAELPGATGTSITGHPLQWLEDPGKVVSKFSQSTWKAVSDFQDFSNEFVWEFAVGPYLQKEFGLVQKENTPQVISVPGLKNPVTLAQRLVPVKIPGSQQMDPLAMSIREFIRFRSTWPNRWTSGLLPTQAVILARFAKEIDNIPLSSLPANASVRQLVSEMRSPSISVKGSAVKVGVLDSGEDLDKIKDRVKAGVFNPEKKEAEYANSISSYYKQVSDLAKKGKLPPELAQLGKLMRWFDNEELACLTNDLVQYTLEGSLIKTYAWRYFRGIKIGGNTIQTWIRKPVDFAKKNIPIVSHFNRGLSYIISHDAKDAYGNVIMKGGKAVKAGFGPLLDKVQTVVLSKVVALARKLGLEKAVGALIGAGLGAATGGVSVVVIALIKNFAGRLLGKLASSAWEQKGNIFIILGGCGCLLFASPVFVMVVILSGFKIPMDRVGVGGAGRESSLVSIEKSVNKTRFANEETNRAVAYTVVLKNSSSGKVAISELTDDKNSLPENGFELDTGASKTITYNGTVPSGSDFAYANTVRGKAAVAGNTIDLSASAVVIVGTPPDMQPSGWPTSGQLTNCPFNDPPSGVSTHNNTVAIDFGNRLGTEIFATHNGSVEISDREGRTNYGKYVVIKNGVARTIYAHLLSIGVNAGETITFGQKIGTMDNTGNSKGNHLHYEITYLVGFDGQPVAKKDWMLPPFVPGVCKNLYLNSVNR